MLGVTRTKSYQPLQINVLNASQMILPPLASELDNTTVPEWTTGTAYDYVDIVRSGTNYYWCITPGAPAGNAGAAAPTHTDGDVSDGTLLWRYVRWHRNTLTLVNVAGAGTISIARGTAAVLNQGITIYAAGAHNEGYENNVFPYEGAWYAISDNAGGRALAIAEG